LAAQSKSSEDIIKFSKFPAAQAPDPNEIPKIEMDHWPGPPSLAAVGMQPTQLSQMEKLQGKLKMKCLETCKKMCPIIKTFMKSMTKG
jgi:actin-binding LIM protein